MADNVVEVIIKLTDQATAPLKRFLGEVKPLGTLLGAVGVGFSLKHVIDEMISASDATVRLGAAVKANAGFVGLSQKALEEYSEKLRDSSTFSDEAVKLGQALLLQFRNIRGEVFLLANQAMVDLAAKMGGDVSGAAQLLGRALQDPLRGMQNLRRAGIILVDSQKEQIKQFIALGDVEGAQKVILQQIAVQAGGTAEALRHSLGGSLSALKNAFNDLIEGTPEQTNALAEAFLDLTKVLQSPAAYIAVRALEVALVGATAALATFAGVSVVAGIASQTKAFIELFAAVKGGSAILLGSATAATAQAAAIALAAEAQTAATFATAEAAAVAAAAQLALERTNIVLATTSADVALVQEAVAVAQTEVAVTTTAAAAAQTEYAAAVTATTVAQTAAAGAAAKSTGALSLLLVPLRALSALALANPFIAIAVAIGVITTAVILLRNETIKTIEEADAALEKLRKKREELEEQANKTPAVGRAGQGTAIAAASAKKQLEELEDRIKEVIKTRQLLETDKGPINPRGRTPFDVSGGDEERTADRINEAIKRSNDLVDDHVAALTKAAAVAQEEEEHQYAIADAIDGVAKALERAQGEAAAFAEGGEAAVKTYDDAADAAETAAAAALSAANSEEEFIKLRNELGRKVQDTVDTRNALELKRTMADVARDTQRAVGALDAYRSGGEEAVRAFNSAADAAEQFRQISVATGIDIDELAEKFPDLKQNIEDALGARSALAKSQQFAADLQSALGNAFTNIRSGLRGMVAAFLQAFEQILAQRFAQKLAEQITSALANAGGGGGGGFFSWLLGGLSAGGGGGGSKLGGHIFAASGADFTVGGKGGTDANFVPMMLTRGERVRVTPAGAAAGGAVFNITNNVSVTGEDNLAKALPRLLKETQRSSIEESLKAVAQSSKRGRYA